MHAGSLYQTKPAVACERSDMPRYSLKSNLSRSVFYMLHDSKSLFLMNSAARRTVVRSERAPQLSHSNIRYECSKPRPKALWPTFLAYPVRSLLVLSNSSKRNVGEFCDHWT